MSPYSILSISLLFPQLLYLADLILLEKLQLESFPQSQLIVIPELQCVG